MGVWHTLNLQIRCAKQHKLSRYPWKENSMSEWLMYKKKQHKGQKWVGSIKVAVFPILFWHSMSTIKHKHSMMMPIYNA